MSTLANLRGNLRTELKIDPNGRIWNDATLNGYLVEAVNQIQQDGNYDWHFNDAEGSDNTVASQTSYDLPTDFVRLEYDTVKINGVSMQKADYRWLWRDKLFDSTGDPTFYALRGTKIYFALTPDTGGDSITYLYRKKLATMSADTDDSGLDTEFDNALVKWAAYLAWSTVEGRENKGIAAAQDYQEAMKGCFTQFLGRRDDANFQMSFEVPSDYTSY